MNNPLKIMAVGDLHGMWGKLNQLVNHKQPDIVLQCGDFGWFPALEVQRPVLYGQQTTWALKGVNPGDSQVYWCDGNHEDHWAIKDCDKSTIDYQGVTYMPRGSVLTLPDGRTVLFIGGADSIDKHLRKLGVDWFPEEIISHAELERCLAYQGQIDIVISHTCPEEFKPKCNFGSQGKYDDPSMKALSVILEHFKPDQWFSGHFHKEQRGKYHNTYWEILDYPGHGGKWWTWIR